MKCFLILFFLFFSSCCCDDSSNCDDSFPNKGMDKEIKKPRNNCCDDSLNCDDSFPNKGIDKEIKKSRNKYFDFGDIISVEDKIPDGFIKDIICNFNRIKNFFSKDVKVKLEEHGNNNVDNIDDKNIPNEVLKDYYEMYCQMTHDDEIFSHQAALDLISYRELLRRYGIVEALKNLFADPKKVSWWPAGFRDKNTIEYFFYFKKNENNEYILYPISKDILYNLESLSKESKSKDKYEECKKYKYYKLGAIYIENKLFKGLRCSGDPCNSEGMCVSCLLRDLLKNEKLYDHSCCENKVENYDEYGDGDQKCLIKNISFLKKNSEEIFNYIKQKIICEYKFGKFMEIYFNQSNSSGSEDSKKIKKIIFDSLHETYQNEKNFSFYGDNIYKYNNSEKDKKKYKKGEYRDIKILIEEDVKKCIMIEWALTIEFLKYLLPVISPGKKKLTLYRVISYENYEDYKKNKRALLESTSIFTPSYIEKANRIGKKYFLKLLEVPIYRCVFNYVISPFLVSTLSRYGYGDDEQEIGCITKDLKFETIHEGFNDNFYKIYEKRDKFIMDEFSEVCKQNINKNKNYYLEEDIQKIYISYNKERIEILL